jgi:hypothetical protein
MASKLLQSSFLGLIAGGRGHYFIKILSADDDPVKFVVCGSGENGVSFGLGIEEAEVV